jgi:hypothetical protein
MLQNKCRKIDKILSINQTEISDNDKLIEPLLIVAMATCHELMISINKSQPRVVYSHLKLKGLEEEKEQFEWATKNA